MPECGNLDAENGMYMPDPEMVHAFEHFQEESCLPPQDGTFLVDQSFAMIISMKAEEVMADNFIQLH